MFPEAIHRGAVWRLALFLLGDGMALEVFGVVFDVVLVALWLVVLRLGLRWMFA